jgi:hypothetical protein
MIQIDGNEVAGAQTGAVAAVLLANTIWYSLQV